MPRRSSGGSFAVRSAPRPRPAAALNRASPPATAQASGGGSMLGGIGSTMAEGFAFGTGSSFAHRAADFVMGPRTIANTTGSGSCDIHSKAFQDCVNKFGSDISKCQFYMDMLSECRKNSGSMVAA